MIINKIRSLNWDKKSLPYSIPCVSMILWMFFSFISIFSFPFPLISSPFVLLSIIIKLFMLWVLFYFFKKIFLVDAVRLIDYQRFETFVGYGIVISYVFYSFPRMVSEFLARDSYITYVVFDYLLIVITTAFPTIIYLFLRTDSTRLLTKAYDANQLTYTKKLKKDKKFRKEELKKKRKTRNILQNLWHDWVDIILQAILIVMLINQFLFQMYAIPSESMVPTFLKRDMVIVNKLIYGPQIPLTEWKLPSPFRGKSGDIVVYLNPETFDKESDVGYKNVFARIFQPFLYRLTFTKVDIDLKDDGSPKERFIVKRLVAKRNERICMLNNKVYKQKKGEKWQEMSNIKKEKEWGRANLYLNTTKGMDQQTITPEIRQVLTAIENSIQQQDLKTLNQKLQTLQKEITSIYAQKNIAQINQQINSYLMENFAKNEEIKRELLVNFQRTSDRRYQEYYGIQINEYAKKIETLLEGDYKKVSFYRHIARVKSLMTDNPDFLRNLAQIHVYDKDLETMDPYEAFMYRADAYNKVAMLQLMREILTNKVTTINNEALMNRLFELAIFFDGLEIPHNSVFEKPQFYSFFNLSQFPAYPPHDTYFANEDYFLMGDNRYNSLDCRFGLESKQMKIHSQNTDFLTREVVVSWKPHVIKEKFILGKAMAIYFPFDRMRVF